MASSTAEEILKAERAADDRKNFRKGGFKLTKERDFATATLSNGVIMNWHTPKPEGDNWIWKQIPVGYFELVVEGKKILFDTEDFRKALRWA